MSRNLTKNYTIHGVVVPWASKKRAPLQTVAFKPQWRIVFLIYSGLSYYILRYRKLKLVLSAVLQFVA